MRTSHKDIYVGHGILQGVTIALKDANYYDSDRITSNVCLNVKTTIKTVSVFTKTLMARRRKCRSPDHMEMLEERPDPSTKTNSKIHDRKINTQDVATFEDMSQLPMDNIFFFFFFFFFVYFNF